MGNKVSSSNVNAATLKQNEEFMKQKKGIVADTDDARLVEKFWYDAINCRNKRALQWFCAKDSIIRLVGNKSGSSLYSLLDDFELVYISFPDACVGFDEIKQVDKGVVRVINNAVRGTHTGPPYAFGLFPPIPTSGLSVYEDPCDLIMHISNGKIVEVELDMTSGRLVGPLGFYVRIGGRLPGMEKI